jgi:hypothetical protein
MKFMMPLKTAYRDFVDNNSVLFASTGIPNQELLAVRYSKKIPFVKTKLGESGFFSWATFTEGRILDAALNQEFNTKGAAHLL